LLCELGQRPQVVERRFAPIRVARPQRGTDELSEERRLAIGGRAERAEVPRADPVRRELRADRRDLRVARRVAPVSPTSARLEEPVLLELPHELRRRAGTLLDLGRAQLLFRPCKAGGASAAASLVRLRGRELLADDAQRQELVALEPENRPETLDGVVV